VAVVLGAVAVAIVLGIAAWAVLRESSRLAAMPPRPTFNMDDALDWVVEHLDEVAASALTVDDVRLILDLQVEYFRVKGVSGDGATSEVPGVVVIGGPDTVADIVKRAADRGAVFLPEDVDAVVETQLAYLRSIGAIGSRADDVEDF
jgi:hypothetical protein